MEKQFDNLFKSNYRRFVSVAYGYTKKRQLAEEVVQDVFLDFWKRLEKKEPILNHEAYLRTLASCF
jgi:DNA-directed RNA polymerase specialized sigma24 family protein